MADTDFFHLIATEELLNGIPHGIAILDSDFCLVAMNSYLEAVTGYGQGVAGGTYGEFVLRSRINQKDNLFAQVFETGEPISVEGDIINRQRKKIPTQFTITRIHDQSSNPLGLLVVLEDISLFKDRNNKDQGSLSGSEILGHSPQIEKVFELMPIFARTDASVLITGETGTGKDLVAENLHKMSQRGRKPFIKVNCGALPETLLESELFGHVKGAFTGAVKDNVGMFRLAHGGTIFLTEIGDLSLPLQVKLLSVLDDQEFFPVGGNKKVKVDVRVIAATHRSLRDEVQAGNFREDLFYRLNVLRMHLPPLRERHGDINLLLDHFVKKLNGTSEKTVKGFTQKALRVLCDYQYPGNVRELRNIAEYCVNLCQKGTVSLRDLPKYVFDPVELPSRASRSSTNTRSDTVEEPTKETGWAKVEKQMIIDALRETSGNRTKAAKHLGWGRTTLWRKLRKYQLD